MTVTTQQFGSAHTECKLQAVQKYLGAFTTVSGRQGLIFSAVLAAFLAQATPAQATAAVSATALSLIDGSWRVMDGKGKIVRPCTAPQKFSVSADRKSVGLTVDGVPPFSSNYLVLHDETTRVLLFIENEKRLTASGDPILWWAVFEGPDEFRWRRYDWPPGNRTAKWVRCK